MFPQQFTCHKCLLYSKPLQGVRGIYSVCTWEFVKRYNDNKNRNILTSSKSPDTEIGFSSNAALQGLSLNQML